eukprot:scaffold1616_cov100-Skeletonema_dohrnii-CCMP3373.AAC.1
MGLQYELRLQKELTAPPIVFCQANCGSRGVLNGRMERLYKKLALPSVISSNYGRGGGNGQSSNRKSSNSNNNKTLKEGIFSRTVKPSLFIGTRGIVASTAAYALGSKQSDDAKKVKRVREVMKMGADGALIVLDWEVPLDTSSTTNNSNNAAKSSTDNIDIYKPNSITKPIILLLHGMNNDSTFGYIRSMMRTATDRGWIAVGMNLRGQDGLHQ